MPSASCKSNSSVVSSINSGKLQAEMPRIASCGSCNLVQRRRSCRLHDASTGTSTKSLFASQLDRDFRARRQLHHAAGRHRARRAAGVSRILARQLHFADRRIIDDFQPVAAVAIVAAEHVEIDRRHDAFEHVRVFLLRIARPGRADRAHVVATASAFIGAIANLHLVRQAETAGCKSAAAIISKSEPLATFTHRSAGKPSHAHVIGARPKQIVGSSSTTR